VFIRPVAPSGPVTVLVVTVALSLFIDAINGSIWGYLPRAVSSPFGEGAIHLGSVVITAQQLGMAGLILFMLACAGAFFRFTLVGLKMRAATANAASARLLGLRVTSYLALGWGLAGLFGGAVGVSASPLLGLDPTVFLSVLIYAFAGAVLGGMDSLPGATVGGVILGVTATLLGAYVPVFNSQLNIVPPFVVMLAVLLVRPAGLLGKSVAGRV
jgi:branched-chain amino acid transport system permease protein